MTNQLTDEQQQEILKRDKEYEAGETEIYSLEEIIRHFNIIESNVLSK